jgi:hypothetical protein
LIEHPNANRVEMNMNRARAILVSLIPALLLLASAICFTDPVFDSGRDHFGNSLCAGGQSKHHGPPADISFDQAVRRWSRRLNVSSCGNGSAPPTSLAKTRFSQLDRIAGCIDFPRVRPELIQSWQFHWRTASEPRAPAFVS